MTETAQNTPNLRRIEILAFRDAQILDIAGPLQVFVSANQFLAAAGLPPAYDCSVVAPGGAAMTSAGLGLCAAPLPPADAPLHTLVVAGGAGVAAALGEPRLIDWIARRAGKARRVVSICTGAFLLAGAGLLDGRRATTHWARAGDLAARYPAIRVEAEPVFLEDGPVWTSAGVTAGIDLCLELVERDVGRDIALAIARDLVLFLKRPGNQAQFSETLSLQASDRFARLLSWMRGRLEADLSVPALAAEAGMSERSFVRHFTRDQGLSPARAVLRLRIEAARRLLADTDLPVKAVAARCGFSGETAFRRAFERLMDQSPAEYRRTWSASGAGGRPQ